MFTDLILMNMKKGTIKTTFWFAVAVIIFCACSESSNRTSRNDVAVKDEMKQEKIMETPSHTDVKKMERSAELSFRVKDVNSATGLLEKLTVAHGGYVAKSNYDVDEVETLIKKVSSDSAEEIKKLEQRNHLELYVLNSKLDSFLDRIKPLVDHLNYRHLSANQFIAETKTQQNAVEYDYSKEANKNGNVSSSNQFIAPNDAIMKRSKFASVSMDIYQTPVVKKWMIPNPDSFDVARGGFWEDFLSSVKTGGRGILGFINFLVPLWPLFLLFSVFWIIWRKRKNLSILPAIIKKK
jgi:hypothetical protein